MVPTQQRISTKKVMLSLLSLGVLIIAQVTALGMGNVAVTLGIPQAAGNVIAGINYVAVALAGLALLCRLGLQEPLSAYRITRPYILPVWLAAAFLLPALVCLFYVVFVPGHWANIGGYRDKTAIMTGGIFFYGLATGIVEEAVFRGVIMTALERRWNRWVAVFVPSILFATLHIIGNKLDTVSIVQLLVSGTAVGVMLSLVACESGSIWSGAAIHAVWNFVIISIVHIGPVADVTALYSYMLHNRYSYALSGGDFGVEASVPATAAYLLFCGLALRLLWRQSAEQNAPCP